MHENELVESMKRLKILESHQYDFLNQVYFAFEELANKIKKLFSQIAHNPLLIIEYFAQFPSDEKLLKFVHGEEIVEKMKPSLEKYQLEKSLNQTFISEKIIKL